MPVHSRWWLGRAGCWTHLVRLFLAERRKLRHISIMVASANGVSIAITPGQCRAARGLLDWRMEDLAQASCVPMRTLLRFERAEGAARAATIAAIRTALEAAGVDFIPQNGGGPGVRLRDPDLAKKTAAT